MPQAKRAEALVANRMEVLRQAVGSKRKLYGVEITSVATLFCTIDKDGSVSPKPPHDHRPTRAALF